MKKIVLGLLLLLFAGYTSIAQIQQGDLLISHSDYQKMKAEIASAKKELALLKPLVSKVDSLKAANAELMEHNERIVLAGIERHQLQTQRIASLEKLNSDLKKQLQHQKSKTNEYRYAYQNSGRFQDKAQVTTVWAGLMSLAFLMSLHDNNPSAAYWMAGGSAAVTIGLTLNLNRRAER